MSNQLNYLRFYVKDDQLNLALFALGQKALEYSWLGIILHVIYQGIRVDELL